MGLAYALAMNSTLYNSTEEFVLQYLMLRIGLTIFFREKFEFILFFMGHCVIMYMCSCFPEFVCRVCSISVYIFVLDCWEHNNGLEVSCLIAPLDHLFI